LNPSEFDSADIAILLNFRISSFKLAHQHDESKLLFVLRIHW